jgi:hypothetical protein
VQLGRQDVIYLRVKPSLGLNFSVRYWPTVAFPSSSITSRNRRGGNGLGVVGESIGTSFVRSGTNKHPVDFKQVVGEEILGLQRVNNKYCLMWIVAADIEILEVIMRHP